MSADGVLVERLHSHAEVIHVPALPPGSLTAESPEFTVHRNQVDERTPRPQLNETEFVLPTLDGAAEHVAIEPEHPVEIDDAQNDVVDLTNADHGS